MSLKVINKVACHASSFEADPYIPFVATWGVGGSARPLYRRISGNFGGEVEIKVDPDAGALREVIVIESPPVVSMEDYSGVFTEEEAFGAVIDTSPWGVVRNPDYSRPAKQISKAFEDLSLAFAGKSVRLSFSSDNVPVRVLECGSVRVEIGSDETLLAVVGTAD